jgi:hypothetical protein
MVVQLGVLCCAALLAILVLWDVPNFVQPVYRFMPEELLVEKVEIPFY